MAGVMSVRLEACYNEKDKKRQKHEEEFEEAIGAKFERDREFDATFVALLNNNNVDMLNPAPQKKRRYQVRG